MSRFLFTCWPFTGHVMPQMSIATALRDRGHEVSFYTGESARGVVDAEKLHLHAFSAVDERAVSDAVLGLESGVRHGRPSPAAVRRTFRAWLVETVPAQMADLEEVVQSWQPDVVVTDLSMWGPIVVLWEKTGIPVALSSTFMGPLTPGRDAPPPGFGMNAPRTPIQRAAATAIRRGVDLGASGVRSRVDHIRAAHGLGPVGCSINEYTGRLPLYLVMGIRELDFGRRDVPRSVRYVGACVWHPPEPPGTVEWLDGLPSERPWVHVTESTIAASDPFVLRAAALGLRDAPVEAILTTGNGRDPSRLDLGPSARNVHVRRWLSHDALLPRCAAVVTTGGPGTIMAALRAGIPLVIVPTTWDKPDNARRVVDAGVGVRLSPRKCSPAALRAAVESVLSDASYTMCAKGIADLLANAPGPEGAAELLEGLAGAPRDRAAQPAGVKQ